MKFVFSLKHLFIFSILIAVCIYSICLYKKPPRISYGNPQFIVFKCEELFNTQNAKIAIENLQLLIYREKEYSDLNRHYANYPPAKKHAKELIKKYEKLEKIRQEIIKQYKILKSKKKWKQAQEELDKLDFYTPPGRLQERKDFLEKELLEISPFLK